MVKKIHLFDKLKCKVLRSFTAEVKWYPHLIQVNTVDCGGFLRQTLRLTLNNLNCLYF